MWSADPQQTIKSNNAKVPLLVTLQHSNQNQLWTGLIRQRHCTPNQKFIIIMGGKHKSLTISFFVAKVRNIRYTAETEDLVWRQRSGRQFRYSLVISKI